jgi:hypothetical protein
MSSIQDARFKLDRQLLDRQATGLPAHVEQIDCVLCEDDATVMAYVYLKVLRISDDLVRLVRSGGKLRSPCVLGAAAGVSCDGALDEPGGYLKVLEIGRGHRPAAVFR